MTVIGGIVMVLAIPISSMLAYSSSESDFFYEDGSVKRTEDRPAINPDLAPDDDCNIAYELKCVPGSQQECRDLGELDNGEDNVCSPADCQEGYMTVDDDESGLCYPTDEDCGDYGYVITYGGERFDYVFVEGEDGEGDRCADPAYLCEDESSHCREYLNDDQ
jgi:hypothetical protein